jgi:hypothetical protein
LLSRFRVKMCVHVSLCALASLWYIH